MSPPFFMKIHSKFTNEVVDKQFKIIGVDMKFADIPENDLIEVEKKKVLWYEHFKFTEEQESEWRDWIEKNNRGRLSPNELMFIELRYGFVLDYKKKGEFL